VGIHSNTVKEEVMQAMLYAWNT